MAWDEYKRNTTYSGETTDVLIVTKAICGFAKENSLSEIEINYQNGKGPVSIRVSKPVEIELISDGCLNKEGE